MNRIFLQKHIDFLLILAFFAIPPIFNSGASSYSATMPIPALILQVALCVFIFIRTKVGKKDFKAFSSFSFVVLLLFLFLNAIIWNFAASFFSDAEETIQKIPPQGFLETSYTVLCLFISALYEEMLYRHYLPYETVSFDSKQKSLPYRVISEISIILIFALGHRYLGFWAVLNAFCAGVILRFFCIKTGSFISGFAAHFAYNLIVFFAF